MSKARKKRKSFATGRLKAGSGYENALCELLAKFYPRSSVSPRVWVEGPDGRRELDVEILHSTDDRSVRGVVECKDFDPARTGPVGIKYVDELDSKRRDLGLEFAFICSNSGFTADAIRKARRVKIGLLGAAIKGDNRIRFAIVDEIYIRHIKLTEAPQIRFWAPPGYTLPTKEVVESGESLFEGRSVTPWAMHRLTQLVVTNPIVKGRFSRSFRFLIPVKLDWPGGSALIERIGIEFSIEGAWFSQTVQLDSTAGLYDWLRRRMRLAPDQQQVQYQMININYFAGEWIKRPPDLAWENNEAHEHEAELRFVHFSFSYPEGDVNLLDRHIVREDLKSAMAYIEEAAKESVPGMLPERVPDSERGKKLW